MSNYIEYNDKIAFHPGYYIKEIVDDCGLTQEDFAKRLGTTPKNLSYLIRGEQSLSIDIAMKLSRLQGTSVSYWINLQSQYDALVAEFISQKELDEERKIFKYIDYKYFKDNFGFPDLPRKIDEQISTVRKSLNIASLTVLSDRDMAVSFRKSTKNMSESNIVKANLMVQMATNEALQIDAPKYNKSKFEKAVEYALTLTTSHESFYDLLYESFRQAGVILVLLPNVSGSKINGATKKIKNNIMLMVNDRRLYSDTFWFTLFHEIGHIMHGDYGISFEKETGTQEIEADRYAQNALIPENQYEDFVKKERFSIVDIKRFAESINRDPAIVLGRLQREKLVDYNDVQMNSLRRRCKIITSGSER